MKINSSTINMSSNRAYSSSMRISQSTTKTQPGTGNSYTQGSNFLMAYYRSSQSSITSTVSSNKENTSDSGNGQDTEHPLSSDLYSNLGKTGNRIQPARTSLAQLQNQLLQEIEAFMERIRNQLLGIGSSASQSSSLLDLTTSSSQPGSFWTRQDYMGITYSEEETTSFTSNGVVETEDGRRIDFNISMEMSRSFMEKSEVLCETTEYILTDPLVIHLSDAPETISDQTFMFDLDCDGTKEEISQLETGSGFLALDANDNGIIDDGSELFGTTSGNGFKDLAAYDEDGNGWIDENDSIYSKLKIWTRDTSGKDHLTGLKEADVGAIYLGSAGTLFSHNDLETNETKAMVRQTGIYLRESTGTTGYVQQIDLASRAG